MEEAGGENLPDLEVALSELIIDDTILLANESIDKSIIAAYEENHKNSEPYPPLHGNNAVYFHIGQSVSEPGKDSHPTVSLIYKPDETNLYTFITFSLTEGSTLMRGEKKLSPGEIKIIENTAKLRSHVPPKTLEKAVDRLSGQFQN